MNRMPRLPGARVSDWLGVSAGNLGGFTSHDPQGQMDPAQKRGRAGNRGGSARLALPCLRVSVVKSVYEFAGLDAEAMSEPKDGGQLGLSAASLKPTNRRWMHVRLAGEAVLRDAFARPQFLHAFAEGAACAVGIVVERISHPIERGGSRPTGPEHSGREHLGRERVGLVAFRCSGHLERGEGMTRIGFVFVGVVCAGMLFGACGSSSEQTTNGTAVASTATCEDVSLGTFEGQTWSATRIEAVGVGCDQAEEVAGQWAAQQVGGPDAKLPAGWNCASYCHKGSARVSFTLSYGG